MLKNSERLSKILSNLKQDSDGEYFKEFSNNSQEKEIAMRTATADLDYNDYFYEIDARLTAGLYVHSGQGERYLKSLNQKKSGCLIRFYNYSVIF